MSSTQQPVWKLIGRLGDKDPVAHGGGFVYEDTTGVYPPEVELVEPATDEAHKRLDDKAIVTISRFIIERDPTAEWWYSKLAEVAQSCGHSLETYQEHATADTMRQALMYQDLVGYFGAFNFDQYPLTMTEAEAYARYKGII